MVLPLYVGWWQLGRRVSLNPLETAAAMGAPLLADINSNAGRSRIVEAVGKRRVRYGSVKMTQAPDDIPETACGATRSSNARTKIDPKHGETAVTNHQSGARRLRLVEIDSSASEPAPPRPGETFV
jgi:hypothetical protein